MTESPAATPRTSVVGPNGQRVSGGGPDEREQDRYARARTTSDPSAAFTYRIEWTDGRRRFERAQALFPALAVLNDEITRGGRRVLELRWLKDSLHGVSLAALAERSGRTEGDVRRAVHAAARRLCRNDFPRRFREDSAVVTARAFGS